MSNGIKIYDGQTVLVTGASRGIGNAIAILIKELGARVITVSTKNEFDDSVSDKHYGVNFLDQEDMDSFTIDLATQKIDVVINNAGVNKFLLLSILIFKIIIIFRPLIHLRLLG